MKKFKAVIFDMDGTIVDTAGVWTNANTLFLLKHHIFSEKLLHMVNSLLHGIPVMVKIDDFKNHEKISFGQIQPDSARLKRTLDYKRTFAPFHRQISWIFLGQKKALYSFRTSTRRRIVLKNHVGFL